MPGKKKGSRGKKMDLNAFNNLLGGPVATETSLLPTGPQLDRPEEDRYGNRVGDTSNDKWSRHANNDNNNNGFANSDDAGDWRKKESSGSAFGGQGGSRFGQSRLNRGQDQFSTSESRFGALDSQDSRDSRPAHLRRFGKGTATGPGGTTPFILPTNNSQNSNNNNKYKKKEEKKKEQLPKRDIKLSDDLENAVLVGDISDRTTTLESCILDRKEVASIEDLTTSLKRLDVSTLDEEGLIVVLQKTVQAKTVTMTDMLATLKENTKTADEASNVLTKVFSTLSRANGEMYLRNLVSDLDYLSTLSNNLDGEALSTYLETNDLYFLKPMDDLSKTIDLTGTAAATLTFINGKVDEKLPVDYLTTMVVEEALTRVFKDTKNIDMKVFSEFAPLIARCVQGEIALQTDIVFMVQQAWFKAGADKSTIKNIFKELYDLEIVTFPAFQSWRENTKNKAKGKLQCLLKVNNFLDEITPPEPREEYDEDEEYDEEEEEQEDDYLQNPNAEWA